MSTYDIAVLLTLVGLILYLLADAVRTYWPKPPTVEDHYTGLRAYTLTDKQVILGVPYKEDAYHYYLADPHVVVPEEDPQPMAGVLHLPRSRVLYVQLLKEGQEF